MAVSVILFDFDNTIAKTESLREIRESRAYDQLTSEALAKVSVYKPIPSLFKAIKREGVRIGIVTNAGRGYITPVIEHLGLNDFFDVIVTYTDVKAEGMKPSAKGIELALSRLGVAPNPEILFVGDENSDHEAAYRAGITPVMPSWATRKSVTTAPAMEMNSQQLIDYMSDPSEFGLFAERCAEIGSATYSRKGVYFLPLDDSANVVTLKEQMTSFCLGRYFSQKGAVTAWLHEQHPLSKVIQRKEEENPYRIPEYWYDLLVHAVRHGPRYIFTDEELCFDLVTVIPAKKDKDARLERLLEGLDARLEHDERRPACVGDLLYYLDDAQSQKTLPRTERSYEARRALHLNEERAELVVGRHVLVVDDVTTTGATIERARTLLLGAGAATVFGLAIAKTVSIMEDERLCPMCGRPMKVKRNGATGEHFWGCTGYGSTTSPCGYTEPLVKKTCPKCGRPMRIQTARRNGQRFWSCTGWKQTPACNHSMNFTENEMPL